MSPPRNNSASLKSASGSQKVDEKAERINVCWLLKLRWSAIAGQLVTIFLVAHTMHFDLPILPLVVIIGLEVIFLSLLLYFTGGPFNPFSFLYLVYIAQAAVVLPARLTWGLVALS